TNKDEENLFKTVLGDGKRFGVKIDFKIQLKSNGLPEAFIIGEEFIKKKNVALILGDNFFYGQGFTNRLKNLGKNHRGALIFTYNVSNPSNYGVVEYKKNKVIDKIVEKPKRTKSNQVITGLYFFDCKCVEMAKKLKPSKRNELEIIDIIKAYHKNKNLKIEYIGRGSSWLDTGTIDNFYEISQFISNVEKRQGLKIACLEEIAFRNKWINKKSISDSIKFYGNCEYSTYLKKIIK
ncbi:MAG: glucose-1-phosphate thymidylyltransferase, partial [Gammaproteobacteria bacterium]|nr:glucose-1-phosphate thymidylyltransferase [Gammaproteobacteria bacterium]